MAANPVPHGVQVMMAQRDHRLHHYLWHQVRNGWFRYSDDERAQITALGWAPPRPSFDAQGNLDLTNGSGEDFLYMHRGMIANVNEKLIEIADSNYPKITGWPSIPSPTDADYPVPPAWSSGDLELDQSLVSLKADTFYTSRIKPLESRYKDPAYLKTISLGELGARVEFTVHNWLHMRFCSQVLAIRPDPSQFSTDVDPQWDDVSYDWLGDTYSSHVNTVFWKVHGWVDDRINDWATANNVTGPILWNGTWVGPMPMHPVTESLHAMLMGDMNETEPRPDHNSQMLRLFRVVAGSGVNVHLNDHLFILDGK